MYIRRRKPYETYLTTTIYIDTEDAEDVEVDVTGRLEKACPSVGINFDYISDLTATLNGVNIELTEHQQERAENALLELALSD